MILNRLAQFYRLARLAWYFLLLSSNGLPAAIASSSVSGFTSILPPDFIVEVDWLRANQNHSRLLIVDVRDKKAYSAGHIPGAVNVPVDSTFSSDKTHSMVAPISAIQEIFSQAGISSDADLVLYDAGQYANAAREFWVLQVYGHQHVSILNGGFKLWQKQQLEISTAVPKLSRGQFIPTIVPEILSTKFTTRLAINDASKLLIDVRTPDEYKGLKSKTSRYGHIPTAINVPSTVNYTTVDGINKIKPLTDLRKIYHTVDASKKVIAYCNKGKDSALTYFVLKRLGFNVSAYDGSWFEWSNDFELPIVSPAGE